ncbi:MAG: class I SAM-dependent methyltransferase [Hymenobacter sp.]|nr:MAG: class I SAM-dependent methyltransferase [Hymenobacter sp.]
MPSELLLSCPICNGSDLHDHLRVQDKSVSQETFLIQQCGACGFQLTNPRPDAASIGRYYESAAYVSHNPAAAGLVNQVYKAARYFTVRRKVALISRLNGDRAGRLLDYGCGTGHFLAAAKAAGWQVTGLEPSELARADAAARVGQPVGRPTDLASLPASSFDAVTLWHVLEHVHTLHDTLAQLLRVLRPGGRLLIAVPNAASRDAREYGADWAAYDVPRHLYHFTPPTMRQLLARHGLRITQQLPLPLDAYYVSMLSEGRRPAGQRRGRLAMLHAGWVSNRDAARHGGNYSSVLYVAERG